MEMQPVSEAWHENRAYSTLVEKMEENLESRLPAGGRVLLVPGPLSNKTFQR